MVGTNEVLSIQKDGNEHMSNLKKKNRQINKILFGLSMLSFSE